MNKKGIIPIFFLVIVGIIVLVFGFFILRGIFGVVVDLVKWVVITALIVLGIYFIFLILDSVTKDKKVRRKKRR